jgi:hypothetical protein
MAGVIQETAGLSPPAAWPRRGPGRFIGLYDGGLRSQAMGLNATDLAGERRDRPCLTIAGGAGLWLEEAHIPLSLAASDILSQARNRGV